ncbi:YadA-like family protein [Neisseria lisongii]|uniref:YadA-like family protein n=1 Tax=Neisseria lisongii TaxID=2912188 RepID=A0ABY7RLS5_9NEIS|nr:YadA-like family protein [Neisseria lisongii]WCL72324.1 YadA-like family protein [Neisseria lisongii]
MIDAITDAGKKAEATRIDNGNTFNLNEGDKNIVVKQINKGYELSANTNFQIGEKGEPGEPGENGAEGKPGKPGVDGKIGVNGKDGSSVVLNGKDGSIGLTGPKGKDGVDGKDGKSSLTFKPADGTGTIDERGKDGKDGSAAKDANATRIVYETKDKDGKDITREIATTDDGLYFKGDNDTVLDRKLNTRLDVKGGADKDKLSDNNIGVQGRIDEKTGERVLDIKLAKEVTNLTSVETVNPTNNTTTTQTGDGITITHNPKDEQGNPITEGKKPNVSLTINGLDNGNNQIVNVANGTVTYGDNASKIGGLTNNTNVPDSIKNLADLNNSNGSNAITVNDAKRLGWIVQASENEYKDAVNNANIVDFKGNGSFVSVTGKTDEATKVRTVSVDVDAQKLVENAQLPVVYTNKEGDKLVKVGNNFYKAGDVVNGKPSENATPVKAGDVIASMNNGDNSTTTPTTLANVKSNLPETRNTADGNKAVTTSQQAPSDVENITNNAATAGDVLNAGWNLQGNGNAVDFVKTYDTVNFADGKNTNVNVTSDGTVSKVVVDVKDQLTLGKPSEPGKDGKPGKDGVDGFIGVNGKDGVSGVAINGKDGSIGLRGPKGADGKDGSSLTFKPAEGTGTIDERGKDGKDGSTAKDANATRIVYETKGKDGRDITREVATTDDGLYFQGDNTNVTLDRKLNTRLDVKGGADSTKLTEKNIGVVGRIDEDGNRVLDVKLAENIDLGAKGSVKTGDTTINDNGVAINNGPSITKDGIDAGNTVITNVAPGVNPTDAVNVSQLKQNIGDVNNRINKLDKDYQAGIAGVAALAGLPEIHMAGHSMLSAAVGNHKGQSALAVGYSRLSDNSKVKLKIQGSANTQGDITTSVGIGYAW